MRRLAAIGYTGVEIMADVPHAWPAFLLEEQKQAIREALSDNKLAISNINAFMMHAVNDPRQRYWYPSWIEPDRHYRQIRIDHTTPSPDAGQGTRRAVHHHRTGRPRRAGRVVVGGSEAVRGNDQAGRRARREGRRSAAGRAGAGLAHRDGRSVSGVHAAHRLAGRGLNFDIGHAYCVGDDPATTIPRVAKYIRHFHLEDIAATRVHHHLIPGEGAIDFAATLKAIKAMNYQGWMTIELYPYVDDPDEAARTALTRVQALASEQPI